MPNNKTRKNKKNVFKKEDYHSNDGMLTSIWGPAMWHYLHSMSFNYPTHPTKQQKEEYKNFVLSLQHTLPCRKCRENLEKNFKELPLKQEHLKNRDTFSKYIYDLHEVVNKMLGKKSGLTYDDVRERYEHFRARCIKDQNNSEKGCAKPIYGKKSKCILKIVPQDTKCETFEVDEQCNKVIIP
jgi:hypothetical protein